MDEDQEPKHLAFVLDPIPLRDADEMRRQLVACTEDLIKIYGPLPTGASFTVCTDSESISHQCIRFQPLYTLAVQLPDRAWFETNIHHRLQGTRSEWQNALRTMLRSSRDFIPALHVAWRCTHGLKLKTHSHVVSLEITCTYTACPTRAVFHLPSFDSPFIILCFNGLSCVHRLGEHRGQTSGAARATLFEATAPTRTIGGAHVLQASQLEHAGTSILWAGDHAGQVLTKSACKRLVAENAHPGRQHHDLDMSMFMLAQENAHADRKENPSKTLCGTIHPLSQTSWILCTEESLVMLGRIRHVHVDDLSKIVCPVTHAALLSPLTHNDIHAFVFGADHPDKSSLIVTMILLTLESTQHSLLLAYTWARGKYAAITKKTLWVESFTADQGSNITAFICNGVNGITKEQLASILIHRAKNGITPVYPTGVSKLLYCYNHNCSLTRHKMQDAYGCTGAMFPLAKTFCRGVLDALEICSTWAEYDSMVRLVRLIISHNAIPVPPLGDTYIIALPEAPNQGIEYRQSGAALFSRIMSSCCTLVLSECIGNNLLFHVSFMAPAVTLLIPVESIKCTLSTHVQNPFGDPPIRAHVELIIDASPFFCIMFTDIRPSQKSIEQNNKVLRYHDIVSMPASKSVQRLDEYCAAMASIFRGKTIQQIYNLKKRAFQLTHVEASFYSMWSKSRLFNEETRELYRELTYYYSLRNRSTQSVRSDLNDIDPSIAPSLSTISKTMQGQRDFWSDRNEMLMWRAWIERCKAPGLARIGAPDPHIFTPIHTQPHSHAHSSHAASSYYPILTHS
jgi:hypothetical protein